MYNYEHGSRIEDCTCLPLGKAAIRGSVSAWLAAFGTSNIDAALKIARAFCYARPQYVVVCLPIAIYS